MYQQRDLGLSAMKARPGHYCYGTGVGMILFDEITPGFPGDMRNASAYPFPIQYEIAEGVSGMDLVFGPDPARFLDPLKRAAKKLEKLGCRAIAAECGYFATYQKEIAAHVDVPVFMSSLLQVPLAQQVIGSEKVVGILVIAAEALRDEHLEAVGIQPGSPYVIAGAKESGRCQALLDLGELVDQEARQADYTQIERDLVGLAVDFYQRHPNMGALVIECSIMPPFARAIQREIDIPVFSWGTLLDYAYSVVVHRDYYGHV